MIKEIDKEFIGVGEVSGFQFEQVAATEYGYIYKVVGTKGDYYEVFKKRKRETFTMVDGIRIITGEKYSYPSSKAFGIWAWTCFTKERAYFRLEQLEKKYKNV